jgi:hypothetical protein
MTIQQREHQIAEIESITVQAGDIIDAMRRNKRDERQSRSHVLKVTGPFDTDLTATLYVSEHQTMYPKELSPQPVHFPPEVFVLGHIGGSRHPDWQNNWSHPERGAAKGHFRTEYDVYTDEGNLRDLTPEEQEKWHEWWQTTVEVWENSVRHQLDTTESLTLTDGTEIPVTVTEL